LGAGGRAFESRYPDKKEELINIQFFFFYSIIVV
jgi:hypothetical protein